MTWFQKEMDYARESLVKVSESAIDRAADKLNGVVRDGIEHASTELREVVEHTSEKIDTKLDKISNELHDQRQFTKSDVKELVDYAADKLGATIDDRVHMMKQEITSLVQEKVEYFKHEVDSFFVQRQQDIARERRRAAPRRERGFAASFAPWRALPARRPDSPTNRWAATRPRDRILLGRWTSRGSKRSHGRWTDRHEHDAARRS